MGILEQFYRVLQASGVPVSISELIDAKKAIAIVGYQDKAKFKQALKSTMIKSIQFTKVFDICFEGFFGQQGRALTEKERENFQELLEITRNDLDSIQEIQPPEFTQIIDSRQARIFLRWAANAEVPAGNLVLMNMLNLAAQRLAQETVRRTRSAEDALSRLRILKYELMRSLRIAYGDYDRLLSIGHLDERVQEALVIRTRIEQVFDFAAQIIMRELQLENVPAQLDWRTSQQMEIEKLLSTPFPQIKADLSLVKQQLFLLGKKLAQQERKRRRRLRRGKLNFRRTMRRNLQHGGVPVELVYKKRHIEEPHIYLLIDVSSSVAWISSWFFVIAHAASQVYKKIRIFEFDSTIVEVTDALKQPVLEDALKKKTLAWQNPVGERHFHSNYETSLKDFIKHVGLQNLDKKDTIIILGDCRDYLGNWIYLGKPKSAVLIKDLVNKVKNVIILNPEHPYRWNIGDSVVDYYVEAGAQVHHVQNLQQLIEFVFHVTL